jgi:hypothetical protein
MKLRSQTNEHRTDACWFSRTSPYAACDKKLNLDWKLMSCFLGSVCVCVCVYASYLFLQTTSNCSGPLIFFRITYHAKISDLQNQNRIATTSFASNASKDQPITNYFKNWSNSKEQILSKKQTIAQPVKILPALYGTRFGLLSHSQGFKNRKKSCVQVYAETYNLQDSNSSTDQPKIQN